jgi:hypothetical protein
VRSPRVRICVHNSPSPSFPQQPRKIIIGSTIIANSEAWKRSPIGPLHRFLPAARQSPPPWRGLKTPTSDWSIAAVPAGRTGPRLVLPFPARLMSQWFRIPELASAFVLRGTARWLQIAAVGKRPSSGGIHYGPLTRKRPQLGVH